MCCEKFEVVCEMPPGAECTQTRSTRGGVNDRIRAWIRVRAVNDGKGQGDAAVRWLEPVFWDGQLPAGDIQVGRELKRTSYRFKHWVSCVCHNGLDRCEKEYQNEDENKSAHEVIQFMGWGSKGKSRGQPGRNQLFKCRGHSRQPTVHNDGKAERMFM